MRAHAQTVTRHSVFIEASLATDLRYTRDAAAVKKPSTALLASTTTRHCAERTEASYAPLFLEWHIVALLNNVEPHTTTQHVSLFHRAHFLT